MIFFITIFDCSIAFAAPRCFSCRPPSMPSVTLATPPPSASQCSGRRKSCYFMPLRH